LRILLDHNVPVPLAPALAAFGWFVRRARDEGWDRLRNGTLLANAEAAGFAAFVTCDRNLLFQQNRSELRLALVVVSTPDWNVIRRHIAEVRGALAGIGAAEVRHVDLPRPRLRRRPPPPR
jgi:hypothetical protein